MYKFVLKHVSFVLSFKNFFNKTKKNFDLNQKK